MACNRALAAAMTQRASEFGATVFAPGVRLATDNAAMFARAGLHHAEAGARGGPGLNAYASLPLPGLDA